MKPPEIERIRELAWPEPAPELRARVLTSARLGTAGVTWADRIWFSRAWRLACAASVIGALAIASLDTDALPPSAPSARARVEAQDVVDVAHTLGLAPDLSASLARRAIEMQTRPLVPAPERMTPDAVTVDGDRR